MAAPPAKLFGMPTPRSLHGVLSRALVVASLVGVGCGASNAGVVVQRSEGGDAPALEALPVQGDIVVLGDAQSVPVACEAGAVERCNGLDDDCDAAIDEGSCELGTGPLQITMAWDSDADIDLYVTEPSGEELSFQRSTSGSGGHLDQAARGACDPADAYPRVENAYWSEAPPPGEYLVAVHYLFQCEGAGISTVTLSVRLGDRRFDPVNVTLAPNRRVDVIRLRIDE